ncbi:DUF2357 domain-containing protein [Polyangium sp. 15x6]|uniref:DUF2357 domain-containing protein n=1 Tax=Polyangium sp. 15x6 TaxID=3042687 RepID=UPI00249ABFF5|nr:DUF2357 domain-containing protein [Polyangium sp. 15x6]MDI3289764.1 DUF2357 domain-containing protein [Polyangium sp. 15x6]
MSLQVRGADGSDEHIIDGVLRLEEARTYHIDALPGASAPRAWLGPRELPWSEERGTFTLEVGHWVGSAALRVAHGTQETVVPVEVAPRQEKLSDGAWLSLLADLEAWSPGLAIGLEGGGVGAVQTEGTTATILAAALLPLVPALIRAIRAIAAAPRELATSTREDIPLRAVRRADRETLQWLARHPAVARAVDPWLAARTGLQDPYVPQDTTHETVDHPVNRYIAWIIGRIARVLGELTDALGRAARNPRLQPDTAQWCRARGRAAASATDELLATLRRTFLGSLTPMPATEAALLAVQDDPVYARAHALARPFLSPRFRLCESRDGGEAPVRPSFELYELWTLLAVQRALAETLDGWTWTWHPVPGNELLAGFGPGAAFTARRADGARLDLRYNVTFSGYLARGNSDKYSISGERRPDIVISFEPQAGQRSWICLDAKYRVRRDAIADAFASLHIYRDSLRWEAFGGRCRSGLLLAPAVDPECQPWFMSEFRERFGIGAWRLTPGEPSDLTLGKLILARVGDPA